MRHGRRPIQEDQDGSRRADRTFNSLDQADSEAPGYRDIETILKIFYPHTKYEPTGKDFYKRVFVIHSHKRRLVLKIGRSKRHIRKDYITYRRLPQNVRNRYFAKIYWVEGLFMLQKYGRAVRVPRRVLERLKHVGDKYKLKDVREANVMKFGRGFKIVDAERR